MRLQKLQGRSGIYDVLNDDHVLAVNIAVQILLDLDNTGGGRTAAVAGRDHKINLCVIRNMLHQIAHPQDGTLERTDQINFLARIIRRDLPAQLRRSLSDLFLRK